MILSHEARSNPIPPGQTPQTSHRALPQRARCNEGLKIPQCTRRLCACCIMERRLLTACANMPTVGILVLLTSDVWNSDVGTFFPSRFSFCALRALIQGFSLPTSALRFGTSCLRNFLCEGLTHGEVLSKHVIPIDADVVVQP